MELHDLLAEKDFNDLTAAEKKVVVAQCSQEEYQAQRQLILASQALWASELATFAVPAPPPQAALAVLEQKRAQATKVLPLWQRAATYALPIWQVAVAALLLFCLWQAWPSRMALPNNTDRLAVIDTVYLERYQTQIDTFFQAADTVIKIVYLTVDTVATVVEPLFAKSAAIGEEAYQIDNLDAYVQEDAVNIWDHYQSHSGRSLNQDTFLQNLTRQVVAHTAFGHHTW